MCTVSGRWSMQVARPHKASRDRCRAPGPPDQAGPRDADQPADREPNERGTGPAPDATRPVPGPTAAIRPTVTAISAYRPSPATHASFSSASMPPIIRTPTGPGGLHACQISPTTAPDDRERERDESGPRAAARAPLHRRRPRRATGAGGGRVERGGPVCQSAFRAPPPPKACRSNRCISSTRAFGTTRSVSNLRSRATVSRPAATARRTECEQRQRDHPPRKPDAAQLAEHIGPWCRPPTRSSGPRPGRNCEKPVRRRTIVSSNQRITSTPTATRTSRTASTVECTAHSASAASAEHDDGDDEQRAADRLGDRAADEIASQAPLARRPNPAGTALPRGRA